MSANHTPLELWTIDNIHGAVIDNYEDAAFIVKAVNCHDELVAALELAINALNGWAYSEEDEKKARAIIAKTKEST